MRERERRVHSIRSKVRIWVKKLVIWIDVV
jgi:hypothetical protein